MGVPEATLQGPQAPSPAYLASQSTLGIKQAVTCHKWRTDGTITWQVLQGAVTAMHLHLGLGQFGAALPVTSKVTALRCCYSPP